MIEIDGSSGGGQIIRTGIALSAYTGKAAKFVNIRGSRPKPGLKIQHMEGIKAAGKLCDAKIKGLELGSNNLEFVPGKLKGKNITIDISTAGSIGLILQILTIITPHLEKDVKIEINGGGTWNKWAPPVIYFEKVLFPLTGDKSEIKIIRNGFYPKGGAKVEFLMKPYKVKSFDYTQLAKDKKIYGISLASEILEKRNVAERQKKEVLRKLEAKIKTEYVDSFNPGSGLLLWNDKPRIGGNGIGERGKMAEDVAREALYGLNLGFKGGVDKHAADMLLPFMAFGGHCKIKYPTKELTNHMKTNMEVIEKFLDIKFKVDKDKRIVST